MPVPHGTPHTIDLEWQVLLMEAVRTIDESRSTNRRPSQPAPPNGSAKTILVIDDSAMLLSFVKEIWRSKTTIF